MVVAICAHPIPITPLLCTAKEKQLELFIIRANLSTNILS